MDADRLYSGWALLFNPPLVAMFERIFNNSTFRTSLPFVTLAIGIATYALAIFSVDDHQWKEFWSGFGKTLLTGGIFALLLKSYQFMGVFKEELSAIIYDAAHLRHRKDLHDLWGKVSRVMFNNKFPNISEVIMSDVKNIYFPTNQISYCDDFKQMIHIELIDKVNQVVKVTQQSKYQLYPNEKSSILNFRLDNKILFVNRDQASFKVENFKVNGVDRLNNRAISNVKLNEEVKTNGKLPNWLITHLDLQLNGCECYEMETEFVKTYSLKHDNIIGFKRESIIHGFNLKVFTQGVTVTFLSSGTLKSFNRIKAKSEDYSEYEYSGNIYPGQGYTIFIRN